MQEHVHLGQRPGGADGLLPEERIVRPAAGPVADLSGALQEQRARPACGIADVIALLRLHQPRHQHRDLRRGVELAGLLACRRREPRDQELVGPADDVEVADPARAQVEVRLGEVLQQVPEDVVLLLLVAELVGVEGDVLEHVAQLRAVRLFDGMQRLVDPLAVPGLVPVAMKIIEARALRQDELLLRHHGFDEVRMVAVLGLVALVVVLPHIRNVFQEQHGEHVVLVDRGVDRAPEGVARRPCRLIDGVLCDAPVQAPLPRCEAGLYPTSPRCKGVVVGRGGADGRPHRPVGS